MFTKLFVLLSCLGVISLNAPIMVEKTIEYNEENAITYRNYQHDEYLNSYTKVSYKYESNEVESVDDLVVGHLYKYDGYWSGSGDLFDTYEVIGNRDNQHIYLDITSQQNGYMRAYNVSDNQGYFVFNIMDGQTYKGQQYLNGEFLFVYGGRVNSSLVEHISYTDYNEIESVTYILPTTIIGYINEFLEDYLYRDLPFASSMTFEIGGQQVNLLSWLILVTGIVLAVGFLILMFVFIKWLVKIFSNGFLLR